MITKQGIQLVQIILVTPMSAFVC